MSIIVNNTDNQLNIEYNGVLDVYNVKTIKSVSRGVDASGNYYIAINFIANDKNNSLRINLSEVSSPVTWTNDVTGANAAIADIRDWLSEIIEVEISEANDSILVYGWDGAVNRKIKTDANGELQVDILRAPATYSEDTVHSSGNTGSFILGVRNDSGAVMTSNDGDYSPIAVTDKGAVKVDASISFPSNLDVNVFDGAGTNPITSTTVGPDTGLDVYIVPANAVLSLDSLEETGTTGDLSALSVNITSISFLSTGTANALVSINGGSTFINVAPGTNISFDAGSPSNVFVGSSFYWDTLTNAGSALTIVYSYL